MNLSYSLIHRNTHTHIFICKVPGKNPNTALTVPSDSVRGWSPCQHPQSTGSFLLSLLEHSLQVQERTCVHVFVGDGGGQAQVQRQMGIRARSSSEESSVYFWVDGQRPTVLIRNVDSQYNPLILKQGRWSPLIYRRGNRGPRCWNEAYLLTVIQWDPSSWGSLNS